MRIQVEDEVDGSDIRQVTLDDSGFNVPGYCTIRIGRDTDKDQVYADVRLDELYPAVLALHEAYVKAVEADKRLS